MNWQQFLFNACFQVWKGVLTSWITHLLHVGGANLVIWWRISNVHVTLTWKCWRVKLRPHAKIFVYWGSRNLYRYSSELSFTFFPEDTHTPNKCEAHCELWEIRHLGERWQPDFRIQTTIQTTCVLKPFRNTVLWNTVKCMDLDYNSDAVYWTHCIVYKYKTAACILQALSIQPQSAHCMGSLLSEVRHRNIGACLVGVMVVVGELTEHRWW